MTYDLFKGVSLKNAKISEKDGVIPHPESGINILKYQLNKEDFDEDYILFGNVTVKAMKKALESAGDYLDYALFELGGIEKEE